VGLSGRGERRGRHFQSPEGKGGGTPLTSFLFGDKENGLRKEDGGESSSFLLRGKEGEGMASHHQWPKRKVQEKRGEEVSILFSFPFPVRGGKGRST